MLIFKTLINKYFSSKENGDNLLDLTRSSVDTIAMSGINANRLFMVDKDTVMRPDLVSHTMYSDQNSTDLLLKFNAISNPFSLYEGQILGIPSQDDLAKIVKKPKPIKDISDIEIEEVEAIFINPKDSQDQKRLEMLKKQNKGREVLPSNVNKKDDKNVKVKDGKIVFGEDVTSINRNDCPEPISRANLKKALIKNNLFG